MDPFVDSVHNFSAVIFDFDGTLVDSYDAIAASVNYVRSFYGLAPLSTAEVCRQVGRGATYLLEHTVPGGDLAKDLERYRDHHPSVLRSGTRLLPGVGLTLAELKKASLRLAICSNKPIAFTRELLEILHLTELIQTVVGPEDAERPKPAPDMLLLAVSRLAVSPHDAVYVGDMVVDIQTARAAGVTVWVTPTGSEARDALEKANPDRLLEHFTDLSNLLIDQHSDK
jgi:phosphoglycolate phosphatase